MLQFRSFLITGLMVGAAWFLPHHAFAEKNGASEKSIPEKAAVQAQAAAVQKQAVLQPAAKRVIKTAPVPVQARAKETVAPTQGAAAQTKGQVVRSLAKPEKAVIPPGLNSNAAVVKEKAEGQAAVEKRSVTVNPAPKVEIETKVQPEKPDQGVNLQVKKPVIKVSDAERTVSEPAKKETPPASQEELPKISQMLNQTQRTGSSGGDSNDRVTHGSGSAYGMDKWLEWDRYQGSQLVQLFVARHTFIQNQWMNAPPSPPPKKAPFITSVTR
jgi:hypothetical protein